MKPGSEAGAPALPAKPEGPHPSPEALLAARRGPRSAAVERVLRHAASCADCAAEMARLDAFDAPEPLAPAALEAAWRRFETGPPTPRTRPLEPPVSLWQRFLAALDPRSSGGRLVLGLATAALLGTLGLSVWRAQQAVPSAGATPPLPLPPPPISDPTRGGELGVHPLAPLGLIAAPPSELRFENPEGLAVRIQIVSDTGDIVWTSDETSESRLTIPAEPRKALRAGTVYSWTILLNDGRQTAAETFRLVAP